MSIRNQPELKSLCRYICLLLFLWFQGNDSRFAIVILKNARFMFRFKRPREMNSHGETNTKFLIMFQTKKGDFNPSKSRKCLRWATNVVDSTLVLLKDIFEKIVEKKIRKKYNWLNICATLTNILQKVPPSVIIIYDQFKSVLEAVNTISRRLVNNEKTWFCRKFSFILHDGNFFLLNATFCLVRKVVIHSEIKCIHNVSLSCWATILGWHSCSRPCRAC